MFRLAHGVPHNHLGHRLHLRHYNKRPPTERTVFHLPPTCYGICLQADSSAPSSVTTTTHSAPRTRSGYVQLAQHLRAIWSPPGQMTSEWAVRLSKKTPAGSEGFRHRPI